MTNINQNFQDFLSELQRGRWTQCRHGLAHGEKHTFSGAMCDYFVLNNPGKLEIGETEFGETWYKESGDPQKRIGFLPGCVKQWYEIDSDYALCLWALNGTYGNSFEEIANWVMKNAPQKVKPE